MRCTHGRHGGARCTEQRHTASQQQRRKSVRTLLSGGSRVDSKHSALQRTAAQHTHSTGERGSQPFSLRADDDRTA
jgi:hypothetical protein